MAKLDDLKQAWQSHSGISQQQFNQIGDKVRESTTLLQSTIFRRDMVETFASIVVVAFFGPGLLTAKNWVAWSGFAIVVLAGITIPIVLWWGRKRAIKTVSSANFCSFVDIEIDYLHRQVQLLRRITWWYLLPIYIGIALIVVGVTEPLRGTPFDRVFLTAYMIFCTGLFVFIWWLNQNARKKHLEPLLNYYVQMRKAVDSGDDSAWDQEGGPPTEFLVPKPRKPITRRQRTLWIWMTVCVTVLTAVAGVAIMWSFDRRTGAFVASTAPVVAFLMVCISGIWSLGPARCSEEHRDIRDDVASD